MQLWMEGPTWESVDSYIIHNLETDHGHMFFFPQLLLCFPNATAWIASLQYFSPAAKII